MRRPPWRKIGPSHVPLARLEVAQPAEQRAVMRRRHLGLTGQPSQQFAIGYVHQLLEFTQGRLVEFLDMTVGEAAQDQVYFPQPAMPGPEQDLAPADVQSLARPCRSAHPILNAKSPDGPGGVL